ncbi:MAG: hypothetical protein J5840_05680 [Lachnospiraceae bacterium]|nr:hypothetical protein [Lachnospiraceae bacterium]
MAKRFLTIIVSVLLVLSIAFSLKETCSAANYGFKGAYRANYQFVLYVPYTLLGTTGNLLDLSSQEFCTNCSTLTIPQGETFAAGDDGNIIVKGSYGSYYILHAPDWVRAGKMTKIY